MFVKTKITDQHRWDVPQCTGSRQITLCNIGIQFEWFFLLISSHNFSRLFWNSYAITSYIKFLIIFYTPTIWHYWITVKLLCSKSVVKNVYIKHETFDYWLLFGVAVMFKTHLNGKKSVLQIYQDRKCLIWKSVTIFRTICSFPSLAAEKLPNKLRKYFLVIFHPRIELLIKSSIRLLNRIFV